MVGPLQEAGVFLQNRGGQEKESPSRVAGMRWLTLAEAGGLNSGLVAILISERNVMMEQRRSSVGKEELEVLEDLILYMTAASSVLGAADNARCGSKR